MKTNYIFFFKGMLILLVAIGMLRFLGIPKYLDLMLLIAAIIFGIIGLIKKFKR